MTTMTVSTVLADAPLTALDRCDRCGAQAYVRATIAGGELLFCSHHFREHGPGLEKHNPHIYSELTRLDAETAAATG